MSSVYYEPEHHGLSIFGELDEDDLCYEFNMLVVWQDTAGQLFWSQDSG